MCMESSESMSWVERPVEPSVGGGEGGGEGPQEMPQARHFAVLDVDERKVSARENVSNHEDSISRLTLTTTKPGADHRFHAPRLLSVLTPLARHWCDTAVYWPAGTVIGDLYNSQGHE